MHQIRCVTQNALNYLEAKTLTGRYKMQSKLNVQTGIAKLKSYSSEGGVESLSGDNLVMETINYYMKGKFGNEKNLKLHTGKNSGIGMLYGFQNKFDKGESTGSEPKFVREH